MESRPNLISGFVGDSAGKPVTGARVYFTGGPVPLPDIAALTDGGGAFSLSVPSAGIYEIECNADGFAPEAVTVALAPGQTAHLDIRLKR